ncbi:M23 family metallopeptidase [Amycolatopsis minnesotensis]|uniref:M23ase beta-sheet core domain-containing protein n=1 Tax=Amycolatopsis minnesotensis TaxID=337894 RepID=A0ABP5BGS1_9PSEU
MTKTSSRLGYAGAAVLAGVLLVSPTAISTASADDGFPVFGLPFAAGQKTGSAGIHSDDGGSGVKNAIDFNPDDSTVRAPLGGTVRLQHCSGGDWVTIDHENGWRTGYYHMEGIKVADGQEVEPGAVLGSIGNALPCGGHTTGAHVHFTLWTLNAASVLSNAVDSIPGGNWDNVSYDRLSTEVANDVGVAVDGHTFGGWLFNAEAEQYKGTATNAKTKEVVKLPGYFRYDG